jgi:hypothetical protein
VQPDTVAVSKSDVDPNADPNDVKICEPDADNLALTNRVADPDSHVVCDLYPDSFAVGLPDRYLEWECESVANTVNVCQPISDAIAVCESIELGVDLRDSFSDRNSLADTNRYIQPVAVFNADTIVHSESNAIAKHNSEP